MSRFLSSFSRFVRFLTSTSNPDYAGEIADFGFHRPEFGKENLAGTVQPYDRHVFLCHRSPDTWQRNVVSSDGMPALLLSAITSRKGQMKKKTKLTICKEEDSSSSSGDVLIFPDMIRYRRLQHSDLDNFVEEVLVKERKWPSVLSETMMGSYVFVCSHGNRDRRCGVCGPLLVKKFEEEISLRNLEGQVYINPCSHIGGHKYAGNVIIFSRNMSGEVSGHWYGYVAPEDVPLLLDEHIINGNIIDRLWRGQMGPSQPERSSEADNTS